MTDDDELRDRLRRHDPAQGQRLDDVTRRRVIDAAMDHHETSSSRSRRSTTALMAAAAVIAAGVVFTALFAGGEDSVPVATDSEQTATPSPTDVEPSEPSEEPTSDSTVLAGPAAAAFSARCAIPSPDILSVADLAFAGTVVAIDENVVTLEPTGVYTGEPGAEVVIEAIPAELVQLVDAVEFEVDGEYLVAASEGRVTVCGYTGPPDADRLALYEQAFGPPNPS